MLEALRLLSAPTAVPLAALPGYVHVPDELALISDTASSWLISSSSSRTSIRCNWKTAVTLDQLSKANSGQPIEYEGRRLHWTYTIAVTKEAMLTLLFLRAAERPVQGIGIKAEKCRLEIAGTRGTDIALWADTAPRRVPMRVSNPRNGALLRFWNQWRDEKHGTTMYRLNNAAMEVLPQPDGSVLFRCSDGWLGPDFDDLVFQTEMERGPG